MHSGSAYDPVLQPQEVRAPPPVSSAFPSGLCNFVLIKDLPGSKIIGIRGRSILVIGFPLSCSRFGIAQTGHFVAQVRCVFQPVHASNEPSGLIYAYVEPMVPAPGRTKLLANGKSKQIHDRDLKMYRVQRDLDEDGTRKGFVVNVTDIWRPIDLIPLIGDRCPAHWTSSTSIDLASEFVVNRFFDKGTFADVW